MALDKIPPTGLSDNVAVWCCYDGTTSTVNDGYNVSSITDLGNGYHQVHFSVALADTNYCLTLSGKNTGLMDTSPCLMVEYISQRLTTSVRIIGYSYDVSTNHDATRTDIAIFHS